MQPEIHNNMITFCLCSFVNRVMAFKSLDLSSRYKYMGTDAVLYTKDCIYQSSLLKLDFQSQTKRSYKVG